ncbi:response regulator [Candidatus Woesearchaeota archaeon]|jgi:DNA-binding response OmpR family regulator|nr:response regulator [Candidatus Woesearchaeota archaeon]MBT5272690.1 response regulator [Candidatus Woesearchaeota archaeon]MBT6040301.1 response regulator [Candidatus Woesearchaeota archaeon]MBT6337065.1 response regulator [Candidatus Woesearchaeota archaeon]MBT7927881.1 response regulator [Candidatus Woesearchaeota archaeon]
MKKSIVIVEDDINIAKAEAMILEKDYDVHLAHDGEAGHNLVVEKKPDIVILDLMIPKLHGYEVCKKIKSNPELANTKVVMVTAKNEDRDEAMGMDIGADDYIMKPFEGVELKHVITQVLNSDKNNNSNPDLENE